MVSRDRAALLDRDGTIIFERNYLSDPDQVALLPGAADGLRLLRRLGFQLVVVTNQSGLSRGYFDTGRLDAVHARLGELLAAEDVTLDGIYVCPHLPEHRCDCRKPEAGLAFAAATDLGLDLTQSIAIGDKMCDIDLGRRVGAATCLVKTGYGHQTAAEGIARPDHLVADLRELATLLQG